MRTCSGFLGPNRSTSLRCLSRQRCLSQYLFLGTAPGISVVKSDRIILICQVRLQVIFQASISNQGQLPLTELTSIVILLTGQHPLLGQNIWKLLIEVQVNDLDNYRLYKKQMEQQGKNSRNTQELVEPKNNSQIDSNPQLGQSQKIQLQQEYPLIERQFHVRRKNQYQNLLDTNINVLLKKKLFGFAKSADIFYRTNMDTQLVFEKHPLKGRTIMPLQKFEKREQDRQRTAQIQQKNIACKTPKQMGSGLPRTAVTKSKRRERYDPLQQMVRKKIQKVDESIQNLLVVDSHKNLIMDQNI